MNQLKPYKIEIENKIVYLHLQEILDNNSFVEIGDYLEENAPLKEVHIDHAGDSDAAAALVALFRLARLQGTTEQQ